MSAVMTCSGLDAGYVRGRPVLRNLDLSLEAGTVLALLGPNGAGKTTLLLTIAGLQPPLGGHIGLGGAPVRPGSPRAAVKAGLVLVPDDRSLFKGLTVTENLKLASRRGSATTTQKIFDYFPDLKRRAKVAAGSLSGGEQQMLAIGRALMAEPRLLLVDELSLGLMPKMVDLCLDALLQLKREGLTILLVEQNTARALDVADKVCVMSSGVQVYQGTATEAKAAGSLFATFLGMNEPV
jgi:branched-chain amino acid transport system ATP-binding protein